MATKHYEKPHYKFQMFCGDKNAYLNFNTTKQAKRNLKLTESINKIN